MTDADQTAAWCAAVANAFGSVAAEGVSPSEELRAHLAATMLRTPAEFDNLVERICSNARSDMPADLGISPNANLTGMR